MDLAMRQGYGACALPLCGGGRLLLRRSEVDQFLFFFSIFIFFIVFSCVLFVFSFMASPRSARTDARSRLSTKQLGHRFFLNYRCCKSASAQRFY